MAQVQAAPPLPSTAAPIKLEDVPRFKDGPIGKIPMHVFENCNQATCNNYTPERLAFLRERSKVLTPEALREECRASATDAGEVKKLFDKKGEEYDWIYALDTIEGEFCGTGDRERMLESLLKVETIMRYNGLFSRFANENPGAFRKKNIQWAKHPLDVHVLLAATIFDAEFEQKMGMDPHHFVVSKKKPPKKGCLVKKSWIRMNFSRLLREIEKGTTQMQVESEETKKFLKEHWHEINIDQAATEWIAEQQRDDDKLDLLEWFKTRYHYFPLVSTLEDDLKASLERVRGNKEMHPIEKACLVWFDIVRIHISHEANKRTGKGVASVMLLDSGYLPPKIGKEDEKEFLDVFKKALEEENGHFRLAQFVAKMIIKTQREYADLKV